MVLTLMLICHNVHVANVETGADKPEKARAEEISIIREFGLWEPSVRSCLQRGGLTSSSRLYCKGQVVIALSSGESE